MKLKRILALVLTAVMLSLLVSAPAMAAAAGKLTTTGSVNLRKGPGIDREVITSVRKDTELDYRGASVYDSRGILWHKVSYKNSSAWVSAKYSYVTVSGKKLDNKVYVISTGSVNLRKGPGTGYAKITSVASGQKLFYLGKNDEDKNGRTWYKVSCSKGVAWVSSRYSRLSTGKEESKYVLTTASVNLRKGPGTDYARIFALPKGKKLTYLGKTSTDSRGRKWYNVSYNGTAGWVSSRYSVLKNK